MMVAPSDKIFLKGAGDVCGPHLSESRPSSGVKHQPAPVCKGEKLYEKAVRHNLAACWESGPTPRPGGAAGSTGASGYWLASAGCLGATPDFAG